ncbi:MAG: amidohydrolase family protein, partial [Chloroflexota bacterium]
PGKLAVVDTDVHHGYRDKADLYPYLPRIYQERLADFGIGGGGGGYAYNGGKKGRRIDALYPDDPSDNTTSAVNVDKVREQLLDGCGIAVAVLTGGAMIYPASALTDLDYASAACRAFNDYTIERWLAADSRFRFTMAICTQDPAGAAQEIDRIGDHPGIVGVVMPCGAPRPFGHRFYHPIYEACVRHGLTVALHFGGEGSGVNPPPTAAGFPSYYVEARQARPSYYQVHLTSFVFEGVFEKFPTLKVAMLEAGFAWVPPHLWKMDADWKGLRYQTPWVKRPPSEYVREHVRFATQPVDEPARPSDVLKIIEWLDDGRLLMFASDHPHWDWDDPAQVLTVLPDELRRRIFVENARDTFPLTK